MNTLRKYFSLLLILVGVLLLYPITSVAECTAEAWDQTVNYVRGDIVTHNNNEWRAKRNTQGVTPGTHINRHGPIWESAKLIQATLHQRRHKSKSLVSGMLVTIMRTGLCLVKWGSLTKQTTGSLIVGMAPPPSTWWY